jgi:ankyrin repeat protein
MFPGVHYNFSCRDIAKHSPSNERVRRRRLYSLEGPANNINAMTEGEIKGDIGYMIFSEYATSEVMPLVSKMIEKGVDVNKKDAAGKTLLQRASSKFKVSLVKELVKAPSIDKTGAVEAVEESAAKFIAGTESEEQKAIYRKNADDLIAIIKGVAGGRRNRRKTRVRSRRIRKTRRASRSK